MTQDGSNDELRAIVAAMVRSTVDHPDMRHTEEGDLPDRRQIIIAMERLRDLIYPGFFGAPGPLDGALPVHLGRAIGELHDLLLEQVRRCLRFERRMGGSAESAADGDRRSGEIVRTFLGKMPAVRDMLAEDAQAAYDDDPAARSVEETIFSYPGLRAITVQRLAHELYVLGVPLLPRMMTEHAHSLTGVDIHPGAVLGRRFFIDHGTGVVIGETAEIGNNVKVYQGVTLGALAPAAGQALRGVKRHPTIEDDVTIYAGATILGGDTVIGRGSVIGGNVFLTSSVPAMNVVVAEAPRLQIRPRPAKPGRKGGKGGHGWAAGAEEPSGGDFGS